jgi:antitoxin ChpS
MLQTLRRAGGSLVMTVPKAFVEQNQLHDGSQVTLSVNGNALTLNVPGRRPRYQLQDLLAEMPDEFPMVAGWDEMTSVGKEVG